MNTYFVEALLICILGVATLVVPVLRFLKTGWVAKRRDILDGLDEAACDAYFQMFCRNGARPPKNMARKQFEELYERWYGRAKFWGPGVLLFAIATLAVSSAVFSVFSGQSDVVSPFVKMPLPAIAALAGAYMWVCDDLIGRCRRLDMSPSDLQWGAMRFVIAIPMGYAFGSLVQDSVAPFIAFALGAFPINELSNMLRRLANAKLGMEPRDDEVSDGIVKLQGTDRDIAERLAKEDIRTIAQLAYCDPVHTTMRTNLSFNFVTDLMNQALAWNYLRNDLHALSRQGLRGAVEIRHLILEIEAAGHQPQPNPYAILAQQSLITGATAIAMSPESLQFTFYQISEDPYTRFLYNIWTDPMGQGGAADIGNNKAAELSVIDGVMPTGFGDDDSESSPGQKAG